MNHLSRHERWYGRAEPPPEITPLRAGPLRAEFENGELRYLCLGEQELVRRVYVAVRDHNWNTIPGRISDLAVEAGPRSFNITYHCHHQQGAVDFRWQARLEGAADGRILCSLAGEAAAGFRYNRIGFCLLHPIQGIAGQPYRATTPAGTVSGRLPDLIGPQRIVNGYEAPLFPSFSSLSISLQDGMELVTDFAGDLFEMEDQRNWTDGSFKTYGTPLSLGYPHQARAGQAFEQQVTIHLEPPPRVECGPAPEREAPLHLELGPETDQILPRIGFGIPVGEDAPGEREIGLVARLRPDHLKAELHLNNPAWPAQLDQALGVAAQAGSLLELALFLDEGGEPALAELAARLAGRPLARVIVLHETETARGATPARWIDLARRVLSPALPGLPLLGGTHANFAQLNRRPPDPARLDGVAYPLNPQVHAFDERSLVEAIEAQRDTVATARSITGGLPVSVSSVTLKPPFNVVATAAEPPAGAGQLPPSVDPRQASLFAAAWTVGSLSSLARGGAASLTYYEMCGWRGLLETGSGAPRPASFPGFPGMIFPVYWVFAFLAEARGAALLALSPENSLRVSALALRQAGRVWLLVASYRPVEQEVHLAPLPGGPVRRLRLNEDTFDLAAADPAGFWSGAEAVPPGGKLILRLKPFETTLVISNPGI